MFTYLIVSTKSRDQNEKARISGSIKIAFAKKVVPAPGPNTLTSDDAGSPHAKP